MSERVFRGLAEQVSWQIGAQIVGGDLAQGTRIENEDQLGDEYGVSRTVIREAMKRLSAKGLVKIRPRTGTKVLSRDHWSLLDPDVMDWCREAEPSKEVLQQLREMRTVLEPGAAALACVRANDTDVERIVAAFERMKNCVNQPEAFGRADSDFHLEILRATHNDYLIILGGLIKTDLLSFIKVVNSDPETTVTTLKLHENLVKAIIAKDAAEGKKAMRIMMDVGEARLRNSFEMKNSEVEERGTEGKEE